MKNANKKTYKIQKKTLKKQEQKIFFYTSSPELRFWETGVCEFSIKKFYHAKKYCPI